jgi:8-oxo-dGTP pyrophosphatase MutT (NUDIX family)
MIDENFREDQDIRINNKQCRGIIFKGNKILLIKRLKHKERYYVFPGGHMQNGEEPMDTALREIEEETTIKATDLKLAFEVQDYLPKQRNEYYFIGKWKSGTPKLSGEESRRNTKDNFSEPMWIEISKIKKLNILPGKAKEWIELYLDSTN